jgi:hypothetical protein
LTVSSARNKHPNWFMGGINIYWAPSTTRFRDKQVTTLCQTSREAFKQVRRQFVCLSLKFELLDESPQTSWNPLSSGEIQVQLDIWQLVDATCMGGLEYEDAGGRWSWMAGCESPSCQFR